jgi:hypothetical protein
MGKILTHYNGFSQLQNSAVQECILQAEGAEKCKQSANDTA